MTGQTAIGAAISVRISGYHELDLQRVLTALFQLEFNEFDEGRTGVLHRPRLPGILPDEIAFVRSHATIGRTGHHFGKYAAVDVNPESWCRLGDLSGGLSRFQNNTPSP